MKEKVGAKDINTYSNSVIYIHSLSFMLVFIQVKNRKNGSRTPWFQHIHLSFHALDLIPLPLNFSRTYSSKSHHSCLYVPHIATFQFSYSASFLFIEFYYILSCHFVLHHLILLQYINLLLLLE